MNKLLFSELIITRDHYGVLGFDDIQLELGRNTTLEGAEHTGHSVEVSSQLFFAPRGLWSEGLVFLSVKESRRGFFFSAILDLCWTVIFWCLWFLIVLGK